jgi:hypothetical protein
MKMLHALVGYLTVTSLPFSPFAFATPLAGIYYDGYVDATQNNNLNSALMNHAIDNLLEAYVFQNLSGCVNATQTHSDSAAALMKRVPGEIQVIEARHGQGWEALAPPTVVVAAIVAAVALSIVWIEGDDPVRGNLNDVVEHSD